MKNTAGIILAFATLGMLTACISGTRPPDTYVGKDGKTTLIESDAEMCKRSCNQDYDRCMDSGAASGDNTGLVDAPKGMFGASGDCRSDLQKCLPTCKAQ